MIRFMAVGCGGSGGKTLAYLMDQLRSDLARHGVHRLPRGWQFVNIDVPTVSESGPDGLGSVQDQGGVYIGCAPGGTSYPVLDRTVSGKLAGREQALHGIATWAPRQPERVNQPITAGAGQYRALGRMIVLSRAREIKEQLQHVWDRLASAEAAADMSRLRIPGMGSYEDGSPVVVFVVSSMAGGAGASMALDVCRLLSEVKGLDPALMGVFMVAPNVFDRLNAGARTGVRPNALAMLGEIVASQVGAASAHDHEMLKALGVTLANKTFHPFARVFPVGRFSGDGMQFGDGNPDTIYRGLGRGLAGLMMSAKASSTFVQFDLANRASRPGDQRLLGWGAEWPNLPWGSYGFASLSMGRDRYREYAAQRIAASAVERLLRGHEQRDSRASSTEQVNALVANQWANTCAGAKLPGQTAEVDMWFRGTAFPDAATTVEAEGIVATELRPLLPEGNGVPASTWVPALRHAVAQRAGSMATAAYGAATRLSRAWHQRLFAEVTAEITRSLAAHGLPYTAALTDVVATHLRDTVASGLDRLAATPSPRLDTLPPEVEKPLVKLKGTVTVAPLITEQVLEGSRRAVAAHVQRYAAEYGAYLLREFAVDVLAPLREAIGEAQRILEKEEQRTPSDVGLARLATDEVAAWPSDADTRVPSRFSEANNEVLLTDTADFPARYVVDLQHALGSRQPLLFDDARERIVEQVVAGRWESSGGVKAPGGLLEVRADWRSAAFKQNEQGEPVAPRRARFDVHVRPPELLERARLFVDRPGESFDRFIRVPIKSFAKGDDIGEAERDARQREMVVRFEQTLKLARPLVGVNEHALKAAHPDEPGLQYRYKFSEIPLRDLPIADRLADALRSPTIDEPTRESFADAICDVDGITKIDVFGSYPNYSPLVFDAVLEPVTEQWSGTTGDEARREFWRWRRARPLPAALPMTDAEREAMVTGWMIGRLTGRIRRLPVEPYLDPVQIWDPEQHDWEDFPNPLLTPPETFKADYDWLPAVLESVLLAIAQAHEAPVMHRLRPYRLLRELYDSSNPTEDDPGAGRMMIELNANRLVRSWLRGELTDGDHSAVVGPEADTIDRRAQAALEWLDETRDLAGRHYMKRGGGAEGGGEYSVVRNRLYASATPMFRDVAPDVFKATRQLRRIVEEQQVAAHKDDPVPLQPPDPRAPERPGHPPIRI